MRRNPAHPILTTTLALSALLFFGPRPAEAQNPEGFIYGEITTRSGETYKGRLRWNDEEAFWGDFFNSTKEEPPFLDDVDRRDRERRQPIKIFGITIGVTWDDDWGHQFVASFGDVERIEIERGERATVVMKSGSKWEVDGGSNDLGGTIFVWDQSLGEVELDWDGLRTIRFLPTPADLEVDVERLHGTVKTDVGEFRGFIQWDQEECLSTDKLDGETRDGKLSIEMGRIRSIARRGFSSSEVTLQDGREYVLDGTNDVDDDNRGIFVDDPRYGRVLISWDAFERVDFDRAGSGPPYGEFDGGRELQGRVTTIDDKSYRGRIVFDLDEAETWEHLNGEYRDVEYSIPFKLIRSVRPKSRDSSEVTLKSGEKLVLEDTADVSEDNGGILIYEDRGSRPVYVEWRDVDVVDFGD